MNTALLAKSVLSQRLYIMLQSAAPWTEYGGVIVAATHDISRMVLQDLETRLSMESDNLIVKAAYETAESSLIILLPGQSLAFTHFIALSAKAFLQDAGLLDGGMAVAGFSETVPASEEALTDFVALLNERQQEEIAVYHGQSSLSEAPTVVMIDPNADLLDFLGVRLGLQGYAVRPAQDGIEGLRLVESVRPDLVITELALPALDGYQVIRRIRQSQSRSCQVVVLTDLTVEQDICKCFDLGAADVIKKPFSPMELEARLRRLLA
ncbi:response regulator transcription factor [Paenibacillus sedimenti]|uniref:Response regulator transcription factor n=1 Tax=Paenibacillus sedimenti TaxID=2770274 RepID=A0A926KU31_9BACL|nr:response regulator transcription factor [Paenibacillus sedimenti]MBD0384212.1 response regulator transcription factor [Paenibacillus sedimenti]